MKSSEARAVERCRGRSVACCLLLLCLLSGGALADAPPPLADYVREVWTTREGLPHNSINAIAQTREGYLWLATWEGAARFNGRNFRLFGRNDETGLPDPGLRALHLGPDGELLLGGSRGGLSRYQNGSWQPMSAAPWLVVALHVDRDGRTWIGTEGGGLLRIEGETYSRLSMSAGPAADSVYAITQGPDGRIWAGTSSGLVRVEGEYIVSVPESSGLPAVPVHDIAFNAAGQLLVATEDGAFVGDHVAAGMQPVHPQLRGKPVTRLLTDAHGSLWLGTVDEGAYRLSERGLERVGVEDGLPNSRVLALLEDRERNIWIGTNGGLTRLSAAPFSSLTLQRGLAGDFVRAVMEHPDGSLWVGTSSGLSRIEGDEIQTIGIGSVIENRSVLSLGLGEDGDVWVGTYSAGAVRWSDGRAVEQLTRDSGLAANEVRAILRSRDGSTWFGTPEGLTRVADDATTTLTDADGLPNPFVSSLLEDKAGRLWVGTGLGAAVIIDGVLQRVDFGAASDAEYTFGFFEAGDGNTMWLATDRGLLRHRWSDRSIARVGAAAGLPIDKPFHIVADTLGNFWLPSNRGVVRISQAQANAVADGRLAQLDHELFDEADGMASAQCNGGSGPPATLRRDGSVWFATARGVSRVRPDDLGDGRRFRPPVVLETLLVDGRVTPFSSTVILPPGSRRIEFLYAGLSFLMPDRMQYRHRLDGFDTDWQAGGTLGQATYTNLPPGDYVFRAEAANPDGEWGEHPATLEFSVAPTLSQQSLFWPGLLLAAAMLAGLLVWQRTRLLRDSERRLRAQVDERTAALQDHANRLQSANVEKTRLLEELRLQSERFARQAREDGLTGVSNRRAFDELLAREFARSRRTRTVLCLGLVDIDHFKRVNDDWSHQVGDQALKAVTAALLASCRDIDFVARYGGEEFAVLLPHTSITDARLVFERMRVAIEKVDCQAFAPGLRLTASIGMACNEEIPDTHSLIAAADSALYQAKHGGRNRVCG